MNVRSVFAFLILILALPQVHAGSEFYVDGLTEAACAVAIQVVETECLPGDPNTNADDQFMVYANVLGVEGSGTWISEPFYLEPQAFATNVAFGPFSANEGPAIIVVVDAQNPNCGDEMTVEVPAGCGGGACTIVSTLVGTSWDPNGYYYTFLIDGSGGSDGWTTNLGLSGVYGEPFTFGPFNCLSDGFVLEIFDSASDDCFTVEELLPVDDCFYCEELELTATFLSSFGDDNDTPNDPSDDIWYAVVEVSANFDGGFSTNLGLNGDYGGVYTFGPFACGDTPLLTISDLDRPDCVTNLNLEPIGACPISDCGLELLEIDYVFEGAVYFVSAFVQGIGSTSNTWASNTDQEGAYNDTYLFGPFTCGETYVLEVFDSADESCNDFLQLDPPPGCTNNCAVSIDVQGTTFNNTGFYVEAIINGTGGANTWISNTDQSGAYGQLFTFGPFNCGEPFELEVFDAVVDVCFDTALLSPPANCPTCDLEIVDVELVPDGEVYYISAVVIGGITGSNGWISNTNQTGPFDEQVLFGPFPCGEGYSLEIFDSANNLCFDFLEGSSPDFCATNCEVEVVIIDEYSENGALFVQVVVEGFNTSGSWLSSFGQTGNYGELVTFGPFQCGQVYDVIVWDGEDESCNDILIVDSPPDCESPECLITATVLETICSNSTENGYFISILAVNGDNNSGQFLLTSGGIYNYGEVIELGPYPYFVSPELTLRDLQDPFCETTIPVTAPECIGCVIGLLPGDPIFDDNDTNDPSDDTYSIPVTVLGEHASGGWGSNQGISGNYGDQVVFGPFPCGSTQILEVFDLETDDCFASLDLSLPNGCPPSGDVYDLSLRKVLLSDGPFEPGAIVEYQLRLRNQGTIDADSVIVTDFPGEGLSFLQANHPNNVIVQPDFSFLVLGLAAGELIEIELRFRIDFAIDTENIINRAAITLDDGDDIDSDPDQGFDVNDLNDNLPDDDESEVIIEDCCQTDPCDFVGVELWPDFDTGCGELPDVNFLISAGDDQAPFYLTVFDASNEIVYQDTLESDTVVVVEGLVEGFYVFFLETAAGCQREFGFDQIASTNSGVVVEAIEVEDIGCDGNGSIFIDLGGSNTVDYSYLWSNGAETLNLAEVTEVGDYVLTITVPGGCSEVIEVFVNQTDQLFLELFGEGPTSCGGDNGFLTVFTSPNQPNLEYEFLWSNEETGQTIDGLTAGEYSVTVTASNGCSEVLSMTLSDELLVEIEGPTTLGCNGESVTLEATNLGEGYTYSWYNANEEIIGDDRIITLDEPGQYFLVVESVTDPNCVAEIPYTLFPGGDIISIDLQFVPDDGECGATGTIFPIIDGNINTPSSWTWTLPNGEVIQSTFIQLTEVDQPGTYIFSLTNQETNCTVTAEITLPPGTFGDCVNVTGTLYADEGSCDLEGDEIPVPGWPVQIYNANNTLVTYVITDANGNWSVQLPAGDYFATPSPYQDELYVECDPPVGFTVGNAVVHVDVLMPYVEECNIMYTYVSIPPLRVCEERDIQVYYCNDGPVPAEAAEIEVIIDDLLAVEQISVAPAAVFGQTYVFELGDLDPFECGTITFTVMVDCNATLGQSQCVEVTASPNEPCPTPGGNWDGAQVDVQVDCDENEEEVTFLISNTGDNPMSVPLQYVVIEDVIMMLGSPNVEEPLLANESMELNFPADGTTYVLTTNQEPGSPGPMMPIVSIEGCGTDENGEFTTGVVNQFPTSPSDLDWYSHVCRPIVGSFDPNAKVGYPLGYSHDHLIERGTRLTYDLYFQNTGNDFANRVVIVDTLAAELDLSTLRVGAASHDFRYTLDSNRVLTFYFDDIMLPDSTTDLEGSQGVVQFSIDHVVDLTVGTLIENEVDIYFDFNAPIKTNRTRHQLGEDFLPTAVEEPIRELPFWVVYPNPTDGEVRLEFPLQYQNLNTVIVTVSDWLGRDLQRTSYNRGEWLSLRGLPAAAYVLRFQDEAGNVLGKADLIIQQ
ncbi:MAG: hypothetical protein AAF433_09895 [Bacteroidota bacterium]